MIEIVKKVGRCILAFFGFAYDFLRFVRFNGWRKNLRDPEFRDYYNAKLYHTLEKSMSYKEQKAGAGIDNAKLLLNSLKNIQDQAPGFHDKVAAKILHKFCSGKDGEFQKIIENIPVIENTEEDFGYKNITKTEFDDMSLPNPENFFLGRSSLREYSSSEVPMDVIHRALNLAQKTPSSCNMQPWHTYIINSEDRLKRALEIQSGNRGFGHKIKGLLIITTDQLAFISSSERYQHWIDGGMYAMSVVYALHSLGVASCCLNWSEDPKRDLLLRREIGIRGNHSIMMMISFGWPEETNKVCVSPRKPVSSTTTVI